MSGPAVLLLGLTVTGRPSTGSALLASVTIAGAAVGQLPILAVMAIALTAGDGAGRPGTKLCAAAAYLLTGSGAQVPAKASPRTASTGAAARSTARSDR